MALRIAQKKSIYHLTDDEKMIYEGSKTFWRHRLTLDLYIVYHKMFHILEIISFHSQESFEAPRIYVPYPFVVNKLDSIELRDKIHHRKEYFHRKKNTVDERTIFDEVVEDMITHLITSRINVKKTQADSTSYELILSNGKADGAVDESILCDKPLDLQPLQITHSTPIS